MKYLFLILSLLFANTIFSQPGFSVKGKVVNEANEPLNGLRVIVYYFKGDDTLYNFTNARGNFIAKGVSNSSFYVSIQGIGLANYTKFYDLQIENNEADLGVISMLPKNKTIGNVVVVGKQAIQVKEDTLSFNADSFKTKGDLPTEELLKKIPGVTVDKDGNISAQGKQVTGVKVNGKEFFGGDVKAATREIPVEMIDKVQIIDDYGDQANFTGNKDGDPNKIINLQLRKDKSEGYFGNATAGIGTKERYMLGGSINKFKDSKQVSLTINTNNINRENFGTSMPGSGGGGRFGGGGGMNAMGRMAGGDASTLNQNGGSGITNLGNAAFNYRNDINKKLSHYGSYVYTNKTTQTTTESLQQTFFDDNTIDNQQSIADTTKGINHRVNYNLEYKPDSNNFIKVSPQFSFRQSSNRNENVFSIQNILSAVTNNGLQDFVSKATSPYYGGTILWNHKFNKKGRSMSLNTNANYNSTAQTDDYLNKSVVYLTPIDTINSSNAQQIDINNFTKAFGASLSYIEPIDTRNSIELSYNYNTSIINNNRQTAVRDSATQIYLLTDSLSNIFENTYNTHKLGANWRFNEKKYNFSLGFAVQPATISTENISKNYSNTQNVFNYFPMARFNYKFTKNKNIEINYNGRTNQPSVNQLQPVTDRSNRQYIVIGNPNLRPEFNSNVRFRFNNFNPKTGFSIFANVRYEFTKDKITTDTRNVGFGVQETKYLNADNNNSISTFYSIAKPFSNRKYNFKYSGHGMYNNSLALSNGLQNFGKRAYVSQTIGLDINAKEWVSFGSSITYSLNNNKYSLNPKSNTSTNTFGINSEATFFLPKNFRINYGLTKNFNSGFANNVNANPFIINGYVEKQFLKGNRGSFRLAVYDLLKQNINISRTANANTITDAQDNRLTQYFLLSFNYKISKFSGKQPEPKDGERMRFNGSMNPEGHGGR
jgi:hypothetical protein